jgi:multidrug efflux system outer membrane protein
MRIPFTILFFTIALAGCKGFLDERPEPSAPAYPGWKNIDGPVKNVATWKSFNDKQLDRLIDQALAANQDLLKGQAQIREARALLRAAGADFVPQPGFAPSAQRSRTSENTTLGSFGQGGITSSQFNLPLTMSYEISLWGRLKNSHRKALAIAEGAEADYAAGKLLIASEVATAYFDWQSLREEHALLEDTVRIR